jgi:hypothetical protein
MGGGQFASQFAATAAKVNPEAPSTSKWKGVRNLFAEGVGLHPAEVYVATISKPGNVSVRFGQSEAARSADVLVAMHTGTLPEVEGTIEAMRRVAAPRGRVGVIGVRDLGGWSVAAVVGPAGDSTAAAIVSASPNAVLFLL